MAMINLIPSSQKKSMAYARRNSMILKWVIIMLIAIAGLLVIFGGSLFYIKQDIKAHENSIKSGQKSLSDQNEQKTLERVSEISGRLSLVVDVLSKEVIFSKLLPHIGSLMPEGASLNGLSLSRESAGGIDLTIGATNYIVAAQALANIQASENLLFENADANDIVCDGISNNGPYPCQATIRAVLVKDNPFLLLNQGAGNE